MKTKPRTLIALLALGIGVATFACRKGDISHPTDLNETSSSTKLNVQLENSEDEEDEAMNDNLFMLANAFVRISNNNALMSIVFDEAAENNGYVKYSDLIALDSRFKSLLNPKLNDLYCPEPLGTPDDPYEQIVESMVYMEVDYYPEIYIPNYQTADADDLPFVCIGAEIDDYDNIISYQLDGDDIAGSTFNESEALTETSPIMIIINSTDHIEYTNTDTPTFSSIGSAPPSTASNEIWLWDAITINAGYRYEAHGKSDVQCVLTFYESGGTYLSGGSSFNNGIEKSLIKKITATDIANSTTQTGVNAAVFPAAGTVSTTNLVYYDNAYITTYEYDWYASGKTVSSCGVLQTNSFTHAPKMKYSSEWYHNAVCDMTVHDTWLYYVNATFSFGNAKSLTKIKRTQ